MNLQGKSVLITGGTGSMGRTLVRRLLSGEFGALRKVIVFSRDEAKQNDMRLSYQHRQVGADQGILRNFMSVLEFRIGDVRNFSEVCSSVRGADVVINAAALKQVPTCEYFPDQAVLTNCIGAANIVRAIGENGYPVDTVVGVSTDKACKPVNVMGMTKAVQERIFISANILIPKTRFICVRYGNVLASRGSVVPLFLKQIRNGGPVTMTVPKMTRFLLSLDEAADTIFTALKEAKPGETYVPRAPAATLENIAKALIGKRRIALKEFGIRPGEKMHEILISEEEVNHCVRRGNYYSILSMLPELRRGGSRGRNVLHKEFSSSDTVLSLAATTALLRKHRLMPENQPTEAEGEVLR